MRNDFRSSAVDRYLNDIARYPMMTPEEEIRLGHLVKKAMALKAQKRELTRDERLVVKRGERAKRRFVEANLRLVVYIAKKYAARKPMAMDLLDLVQEGTIGLMRAAEMFDPERGYKFSTYSFWWCRQAISRALQTQERLIRRPNTVAELSGKIAKTAQAETQRLGRAPTTAELAVALNVKEDEIRLMLERGQPTVSLDCLVYNTETKTLLELMVDPNSLEVEEADMERDLQMRMPQVQGCLLQLKDNERTFIEKRFGINGYTPHTYAEIARDLQLSRERVRQVIDIGLRKIQYQMAKSGLVLTEDRTSAEPDAEATASLLSRRHKRELSAEQAPAARRRQLKPATAPAPLCAPSLCA